MLKISFLCLILLTTVNISVGQVNALVINELCAKNGTVIKDNYDENDDWLEIYNSGDSSVDLKGLFLSDDQNNLKKFEIKNSIIIPAHGFILYWADNDVEQGAFHLNFKLSSDGEAVSLYSENEGVIDKVSFSALKQDISYGRKGDGGEGFSYFEVPTPGASNDSIIKSGVVSDPEIDFQSGVYASAQFVSVVNTFEESQLYYTLDGSVPTTASMPYIFPVQISKSSVLRVKAFKNNYISSKTITRTIVIDREKTTLPVLFVTSDQPNIWQEEEIKIHTELIDENDIQLFAQDAGCKLQGDSHVVQKSFKVYFRSEYGKSEVKNKLFKYKDIKSFKRLVFRASGNDCLTRDGTNKTHMRDGIMQRHAIKSNLNFKAIGYRAVSVYINGQYWGIYNMREKPDKHFIESNYGYDSDASKNFIEYAFNYPNHVNTIEGDETDFFDVWSFCRDNDLNIQENYDYISRKIDIENFTDYWVYEVYVGNYDWLINNMFFWSPVVNGESERYKWFTWDLDFGLGYWPKEYGEPGWNTLAWSTGTEDDKTWNGNRTTIIRALLNNEAYKHYFITRFSDLINTCLSTEEYMKTVNEVAETIEPEVEKHIARWRKNDIILWKMGVDNIKNYITKRPNSVRSHIKERFELNEMYQLTVSTEPKNAGDVDLNTVKITGEQMPWKGKYFKLMKINAVAKARTGYRFVGWKNRNNISSTLEIDPDEDQEIIAVFEKEKSELPPIIFNEISSSRPNFSSSGWIEVYNRSENEIDLTDWTFSMEKNSSLYSFSIPQNTFLGASEYLVLSSDISKFITAYPTVENVIGDIEFDLESSNTILKLKNAEGEEVDVVHYTNQNPWPEISDDSSYTMGLIAPELNNDYGENWHVSVQGGGTPSENNNKTVTEIIEGENGLRISPFSLTNNLISFNSKASGKLSLVDVNGKLCLTRAFTLGENKIDIRSIKQGVYFIQLNEGGEVRVLKFIKT